MAASLNILGVDEAGRGPLAGPVVAASVILNCDRPIIGLNDSKQLNEKVRERLFDQIMTRARFIAVREIDPSVIDRCNILQATLMAMKAVILAGISVCGVDKVLIDGNQTVPGLLVQQQAIVDGDALEECIMAASIVAKVHRDRLMKRLDKDYPGYGFAKHKGYATKDHLVAINHLGPCMIHRMSFSPFTAHVDLRGNNESTDLFA